MNSVILRTTSKILVVILFLFSLFILIRGHDEPGGGFIGGLLAAGSIILYCLAFGVQKAQHLIKVQPRKYLTIGLLTAVISGILPLLYGKPFLTAIWFFEIPGIGKLSSVLLFDIGVYFVVFGAAILIIFSLMEEE